MTGTMTIPPPLMRRSCAPGWTIGLAAHGEAQGHEGNDTDGQRAPRESRSHDGHGSALTRGGGEKILSVQIRKRDDGVRVRNHDGAPPGFGFDTPGDSGSGARSIAFGHTPRMRLARRPAIGKIYRETYEVLGIAVRSC